MIENLIIFMLVLGVVCVELANHINPVALRLFILETRWKLNEWLDRLKGRK